MWLGGGSSACLTKASPLSRASPRLPSVGAGHAEASGSSSMCGGSGTRPTGSSHAGVPPSCSGSSSSKSGSSECWLNWLTCSSSTGTCVAAQTCIEPAESPHAISCAVDDTAKDSSWAPPSASGSMSSCSGAVKWPRASSCCRAPPGEATITELCSAGCHASRAAPGAKCRLAPARDGARRSSVRSPESQTNSFCPRGPSCERSAHATTLCPCEQSMSATTPRGKSLGVDGGTVARREARQDRRRRHGRARAPQPVRGGRGGPGARLESGERSSGQERAAPGPGGEGGVCCGAGRTAARHPNQRGAFGRPGERRGRGRLAPLPHVVQRHAAVVAWWCARNASEPATLAEAGAPASPCLQGPPESSRVHGPGCGAPPRANSQQQRAQEAGPASRGAPKPARSTCGRRLRGRADWPQARSARPKRAPPSGRPRTTGRCAWAAKGSALGDLGRAPGRRRGPSSASRRQGRSTRAAALCRRAGRWSGGAAAWAAASKGRSTAAVSYGCGRAGAHIQEPERGGGVLRRHCARQVRRALVARRRIERAAAHGGQPAAGRWGWGWG